MDPRALPAPIACMAFARSPAADTGPDRPAEVKVVRLPRGSLVPDVAVDAGGAVHVT